MKSINEVKGASTMSTIFLIHPIFTTSSHLVAPFVASCVNTMCDFISSFFSFSSFNRASKAYKFMFCCCCDIFYEKLQLEGSALECAYNQCSLMSLFSFALTRGINIKLCLFLDL